MCTILRHIGAINHDLADPLFRMPLMPIGVTLISFFADSQTTFKALLWVCMCVYINIHIHMYKYIYI